MTITTAASPHTPIRALFLDIDGTLCTSDDRISPGVKHALHRVHKKGIEIVLCTGRTRHRISPVAAQMPDTAGYIVSANGSVLMHLGSNVTLYRHLLPVTVALRVIRAIVDAGSEPYVFEDSDRPGIEGSRVLFHPEKPVGHWAERPRYRPHAEIMASLPFEPVCVSAFGAPATMRPLAARLMEEFHGELAIIQSGSESDWGVEIYAGNVSKLLGVQTVAARLDVDREEVMAIGDHINDIEMLKWAGIGVAMGNALPEIQAIADWVTDDVLRDGVARAIEKFILDA